MPAQIGDDMPTTIDTEELFNVTGNPEWNTGDIVTAEKLNNIEGAINNVYGDLEELNEVFKPTITVIDNDGTLSYNYANISAFIAVFGGNVIVERSDNDHTMHLPVLYVGIGPGGSRYVTILDIDNNAPTLTTYYASESSDYPSLPTPQPQ